MIGSCLHHRGSGHQRCATAVARRTRHDVNGLGSGPAPEGWLARRRITTWEVGGTRRQVLGLWGHGGDEGSDQPGLWAVGG